MPKPTPPAGHAVDELLVRLRRQVRGAIAARLAWRAAAAAALVLWLGLALDRLFEPPPSVRLAVEATLGVVALGWLAAVAAPRLLRRITDRDLVTLLHREHPREASRVATSLDLRQDRAAGGPRLVDAAVRAGDDGARSLDGVRLVRPASEWGAAWFAATALAGALLFTALRPDLAGAFAQRATLSEAPWPRRVRLVAEGFRRDRATGEWVRYAVRGEPAELAVVAAVPEGDRPPTTAWARGGVGDTRRLGTLSRIGGVVPDDGLATQRFRRRVERLDDDLRLVVRSGDARLRLRLVASTRPRLAELAAVCRPPGYLGQEAFRSSPTTLGPLPEGSDLIIEARCATALASVEAVRVGAPGGDTPLEARLADDGLAVRIAVPGLDRSCLVRLVAVDERGLESEPIDLPIEAAPDSPPSASLALAGVGRAITRDAVVPVTIRVDDDHALAAAALLVRHDERTVTVEFEPPPALPAELAGEADLLSLRSAAGDQRLTVEPGDRLSLVARVSDRYNLAPREPTTSAPIEFEVVTPAELLARLGDAQRELRGVVEALQSDAERLAYELDLGRRRLAGDDEEAAPEMARWGPDRALDARKAAAGVGEAAERADGLRQQVVNNRLDQPALVDRLDGSVIGPLRVVAERDLAAVQRVAERLAGGLDPEAADAALAEATAAAQRAAGALGGVAASLDSQQTYNEVVSLLRGLIREQRRVNEQTSRRETESVRRLLFD